MSTALGHVVVVEIGDDSGAYAGRLFAGLGAHVIRVETPSDVVGMQVDPDPVVQDFLHRGKSRVVLPAESRVRAARLRELILGADVLLESGQPDVLAQLGIADDDDALLRPALVRTRISPWGIDGARALDPASDLVVSASGGFLSLGGWPDRAPTRAFGDQSWRMASLYAAVGAMLALVERDASGMGQQVVVSAEEAVATALENALQYSDLENVVRTRTGAGYNEAGTGVYACEDGYLYVMVGRLSTAQGWLNLLQWLDEADVAGAHVLHEPQWQDFAFRRTEEAQALFREIFERFAADRPKAEMYVEAQRRGIAMCPINSPEDLLANEHLIARGFFLEDGGRTVVGAPYRLSATPWALPATPAEDAA